MRNRILQHIMFWLVFVLLNAVMNMLFPASSDLDYPPVVRFLRFLLYEITFLTWKIIPFYFIFYYLVPKFLTAKKYIQLGIFTLLTLLISAYGHRSTIAPMSSLMYNDLPKFNVYSFRRVLYTLTEIAPVVGLAAAAKLLKGRTMNQRKIQALQQEKQAAELNFLKAQSHPHFLFNTLNNLYGLARRNDKNTATSIMKLSNIMRYILQECSSKTIAIEQEVKVIEDYIALEQLRYDERLKVKFEKNVDDWEIAIAPLILLPLVENAFKHGASETRFETIIDIKLKTINSQLEFNILNTCGIGEQQINKGIGLQNVTRQLELIYGQEAMLELIPTKHQFEVNLIIDLRNGSYQKS